MNEIQKLIQDIDNQLNEIRRQYRDLDVQRARLEGKEVILIDIKDSLKAIK
jgi:hypothetical protein